MKTTVSAPATLSPAPAALRRIELSETQSVGNRDPLNVRHHVNGRPATREAFEELQRAARAAGTLESIGHSRACGREIFYYAARLALPVSV